MFVFFDGNGRNCEVSNHSFSDCLPLSSAKFLPLKNESLLKTTGTPDCSVNWPVSSHPPTKALAIFGMELPNRCPRPTGNSQIGATDRCSGRSSPPSLCSTWMPAISVPISEVSSYSFDHVNELIMLKPLLNLCSTF